jgi:FAD/FMN-containing dehydrogenase
LNRRLIFWQGIDGVLFRDGYPNGVTRERKRVKPAVSCDQLKAFADLLGSKGFCDDPDVIAPWLADWRGLYKGQTAALLSPATTAEVSAVVALAARFGIPLVPQGGNTSMVGGATPPSDGSALLLSLRRMNTIRSLDVANGTAVVDAGVILSDLHDAAQRQGLRFPMSLGAKGSATMGGLVSTNAGGTQVLRFGTMRKLTLGLEAVLPDGAIFDGLSPLKKDNRGYDLTQLLIGAEGTLGVVTGATLRLVPDIADRAVAWVGVESPHVALALLRSMEAASGEAIESFEIVPDESLALVIAHIPGARAPLSGSHPWYVLVEYVSREQGAQAALEALLAAEMDAGRARDAAVSVNEAQIAAFWRLRDTVSEAERASGPAIQHDISVAVDAMPDFMINAARAVEDKFPGIRASAFGHLGDGNVHFHVRAPQGVDAKAWRAGPGGAASAYVYDLVTACGGSISAEHGIGQMKLAEFVRQSDPIRIRTLQSIKNALDPLGIMNPEKLVPLAPKRQAP